MEIVVSRKLGQAIGTKEFVRFGIEEREWLYRSGHSINLARMGPNQIAEVEALLQAHERLHGAKVLLRDLRTWKAALKNASTVKVRRLKGFEVVLKEYLSSQLAPRLYAREGDGEDAPWLCYYVNEIEYHPPERTHRGSVIPAYVELDLMYVELTGTHRILVTFHDGDCVGMTPPEALAHKGYFVETEENRDEYLRETARYFSVSERVGSQFTATGTGEEENEKQSYWYRRKTTIHFVRDGEPSRVVVDVIDESDPDGTDADKRDRRDKVSVNRSFWSSKRQPEDDEEAEAEEEEGGEEAAPAPSIEVPVHPYLMVFDLKRHMRLKTHVGNLAEYRYDPATIDSLVIPHALKTLVRMLVQHKDAGFNDVVAGKAGGSVILLTGPPGVGKTLTAEVFAETEERALYSVQCSQLGTKPEKLEEELLKVFARAKRWNAILLLDEADVYVHARGQDMQQNAVVGVFLRVLEYQSTVLFLTTNRPKDVDDAIASRCLARLSYDLPTPKDQAEIWRVLSRQSGVELTDRAVEEIVRDNGRLSGRDVKNLLKLAMLFARGDGVAIDAKVIKHVRQFKPTTTVEKED